MEEKAREGRSVNQKEETPRRTHTWTGPFFTIAVRHKMRHRVAADEGRNFFFFPFFFLPAAGRARGRVGGSEADTELRKMVDSPLDLTPTSRTDPSGRQTLICFQKSAPLKVCMRVVRSVYNGKKCV